MCVHSYMDWWFTLVVLDVREGVGVEYGWVAKWRELACFHSEDSLTSHLPVLVDDLLCSYSFVICKRR